MTTERDKLREDVRFRILRFLQKNPEVAQRELAKAVGVSTGGIHYLLSELVDSELLKLQTFTAAIDKRRYAYVLTPKGIAAKAALTRKFLIRKMADYKTLRAEIEDVSGDLTEMELAEICAALEVKPLAP
jgi:EPS-associated MarR family transcriptional regulator